MAKKLIVVAVALVLVVGGLWFTSKNTAVDTSVKSTDDAASVAQENGAAAVDVSLTGTGDMLSLLQRSEPLACTFNYTDSETGEDSSGTSYISNGSYRVMMVTNSAGASYETNVIGADDTLYMWGTSVDGVVALKLPGTLLHEDMSPQEQSTSPIDFLKEGGAAVQYSCNRWTAQSDSFVPPEDVVFVDMASMM